jgi:hypothetical protein
MSSPGEGIARKKEFERVLYASTWPMGWSTETLRRRAREEGRRANIVLLLV